MGGPPFNNATPRGGTYPDGARQRKFWDELLTRLDQQLGVRSATLCSTLPGLGTGRLAVGIDAVAYGSPADYPRVRYVEIANRFFGTFDVTLVEGRDFGTLDTAATQPVAIVNRRFAGRFLPGATPLGRRLRLPRPDGEVVATVVGVAPDLRMGVNDRDPEIVYLPLAQWPEPALSLAVRTVGDDCHALHLHQTHPRLPEHRHYQCRLHLHHCPLEHPG